MKKIFPVILLALLAAFSVSGCGGSRIADLYDNEKEISSDSNSFNLDGIQQNIEGEKWTASVERLEGNGYRMVLQSPGNHRSRVLL